MTEHRHILLIVIIILILLIIIAIIDYYAVIDDNINVHDFINNSNCTSYLTSNIKSCSNSECYECFNTMQFISDIDARNKINRIIIIFQICFYFILFTLFLCCYCFGCKERPNNLRIPDIEIISNAASAA